MNKKPLSVSQALQRIIDSTKPVPCESVSIMDAFGRVLGEDIFAKRSSPMFAVSAMDGYAVRSKDLRKGSFKVIGESAAGSKKLQKIKAGEALRIFTGARLPEGADTIIIQELTKRQGKLMILTGEVKAGDYIRKSGLDFKKGDKLASSGDIITARHHALFATAGWQKIKVRRKPKMLILSSGSELVMPDKPCKDYQTIASNAVSLQDFATLFGCDCVILPIAKDNEKSLLQAVKNLPKADILVSSGGASVGDYDILRPILSKHGLKLDFYKIAMRPGKPMMYGKFKNMAYLGLPGNPVSVLVCAMIFLRPLLLTLAGITSTALPTKKAKLTESLTKEGTRQHYVRAVFSKDKNGNLLAKPLANQDSSVLSALAKAEGFIVRPANDSAKGKNDEVQIIEFPTALQRY